MSRWVERIGADRSDAVYLAGTALVGGGLGWATAPAWGVVAVGGLVIAGYLLQFAAACRGPKGGED